MPSPAALLVLCASATTFLFDTPAPGAQVAFAAETYLKASNSGSDDQFGTAVALSGDTMVIGAPNEDSDATGVNGQGNNNSADRSGAAYVFVRQANVWVQQAYLKCAAGRITEFGSAVAISGDTIIVGAEAEDGGSTGVGGDESDRSKTSSGAAYVFVRSDNSWTQQAYLKPNNTTTGHYFGQAVAIEGDTAVVGSYADESGDVHVFVREDETWRHDARLTAHNAGQFDGFGQTLAISGDTILVGAGEEDSSAVGINGDGFNNSADRNGAAYIFERAPEDGEWRQQAYLKADRRSLYFGTSVGLSGDVAVVGARWENNESGAAYVFERGEAGWQQLQRLAASNAETVHAFGWSVDMAGEFIVVGAPREDSRSVGINSNPDPFPRFRFSGAAYVYSREGADGWTERAYLKATNTGGHDEFGQAVAASADGTVLAGAPFEDSNAVGVDSPAIDNNDFSRAGAAYVFDPPDGDILVDIRSIVRGSDGGVRLTISPTFGRRIGVQWSPNLSDGSWIELGNFFPSGTDASFVDPDPVRADRPSGYYRAILRPFVP